MLVFHLSKEYTREDFERNFPDDDACLEWLKNYRWPDGIYCKKCQRVSKHFRINGRPSYACECGNHVYPMAGTIFEHSSTPLRLWFYAIFLIASAEYKVPAKQLQRELGVTYKTAWRMSRLIRNILERGGYIWEGDRWTKEIDIRIQKIKRLKEKLKPETELEKNIVETFSVYMETLYRLRELEKKLGLSSTYIIKVKGGINGRGKDAYFKFTP